MDRLARLQGVTTFNNKTADATGVDSIFRANQPRMRNFKETEKALRELMEQRVLVLDGAMGTMLQQRDLHAEDFGGAALKGCNEVLVRTRPDVVLDIHRKYFAAGADIVETDTFGGTPLVLAEYGLA